MTVFYGPREESRTLVQNTAGAWFYREKNSVSHERITHWAVTNNPNVIYIQLESSLNKYLCRYKETATKDWKELANNPRLFNNLDTAFENFVFGIESKSMVLVRKA